MVEKIIEDEGFNSNKLPFRLYNICENENAIHILEKVITETVKGINSYKLNFRWNCICINENAIHILEKVIEEEGINSNKLYCIFKNENAIHLIEKIVSGIVKEGYNYDKLPFMWDYLSKNKSIFVELCYLW